MLVPVLVAGVLLASVPARADEPTWGAIPHLGEGQHFTIDPVVDGVLIAGGATFSELLGLILSTGEIKPTPLQPGDADKLLSIDRVAVTQNIDPNAGTLSNHRALRRRTAYAVLDPILSGVRDGRRALLVDAILYAESIALTAGVHERHEDRRAAPAADRLRDCARAARAPGCASTDLQLSFFSGHASTTGAISATATYLAFMRPARGPARPWITLGVGTLLTAFVSYERVRSGEHFPTDVIMGSLAGAGIGVLVPHFHRRPHYEEKSYCAPPVWIGLQPKADGTGAVTLGGRF